MPSRRQEKVARVVKEVVSEAVANHLSDPRITGFVSITKVEMTPDLRNADVHLSIFARKQSTGQAINFSAGVEGIAVGTPPGGARSITASARDETCSSSSV